MIKFLPKQVDFLESKPEKVLCEFPFLNSYIELVNMLYLKPDITYTSIDNESECRIVASGTLKYPDFINRTIEKTMHIIKTNDNNYYVLDLAEQSIEMAGMKEIDLKGFHKYCLN